MKNSHPSNSHLPLVLEKPSERSEDEYIRLGSLATLIVLVDARRTPTQMRMMMNAHRREMTVPRGCSEARSITHAKKPRSHFAICSLIQTAQDSGSSFAATASKDSIAVSIDVE